MKIVAFSTIRIFDTFDYNGIWYMRIPATIVVLDVAWNALEMHDDTRGIWLEDSELVRVAD